MNPSNSEQEGRLLAAYEILVENGAYVVLHSGEEWQPCPLCGETLSETHIRENHEKSRSDA